MLTARDPNLQRLAGEICARPGGATTRDHALATLLEAAWDCLEYDDVGHCLRTWVRLAALLAPVVASGSWTSLERPAPRVTSKQRTTHTRSSTGTAPAPAPAPAPASTPTPAPVPEPVLTPAAPAVPKTPLQLRQEHLERRKGITDAVAAHTESFRVALEDTQRALAIAGQRAAEADAAHKGLAAAHQQLTELHSATLDAWEAHDWTDVSWADIAQLKKRQRTQPQP